MDSEQISMESTQSSVELVRTVGSTWLRYKVLWIFFVLFLSSVSLQFWMAGKFQGYIGDQSIFISWMHSVERDGIVKSYQLSQMNYPPIYPLLLGVLGHVSSSLNVQVQPGQWLIKFPGIIFDAGAMIVMYLSTKSVRPAWRVIGLSFFCFNPAILFDTAVWGQVDILDGILSVLAILFIATKRPAWSGFTFGMSLLSKFQSIVIAPVLMVYGLKDWVLNKHSKFAVQLLAGIFIPFAVFVVWFAIKGGGVINVFRDAYVTTTDEYPFLSMNAMNIWFNLFGTSPGTRDTTQVFASIDYKLVGLFLLFVAVMYASYYIWFSTKDVTETLLKSATIVSFSFYMLATEIHERYIIMALIFSLFSMLRDQRFTLFSLGLTITAFWNMWTVVYSSTNTTTDIWMVYLNCFILIALFVLTNREITESRRLFARIPAKAVFTRVFVAAGTLTLTVRSFVIFNAEPTWCPWLRFGLLGVGLAASIFIVVGQRLHRKLYMLATTTALVAALAGPLAYNMATITISQARFNPVSHTGSGGSGSPGGTLGSKKPGITRIGLANRRNFGQGSGGHIFPPSGTTQSPNQTGKYPGGGNSSQSQLK